MSLYVLNKYSGLSPPFHLTVDDANMEMDSYRVTPRSIVSHRILRGFSRTVNVHHQLERTGKDFLGNRAGPGAVRQCGGALLGGQTEASRRGKREIPSVSCADGKTIASAVSRQGICAARAQAQLRPKV